MTKKVGVIGLGKLGICLAVLFSKYFKVYGVDAYQEKITEIEERAKFTEPQVNEYLDKYGKNLQGSTDYRSLADCGIVFIITQTPSLPSGKFDSQYVTSALRKLHEVNPSCTAVISSTINIGDIDRLKSIHERIAYNPEFIKQGTVIHDFENPKFVVVGAYTKEVGDEVVSIWQKIHSKAVYVVEPVEAEIVKLSLNVSYTLGITFANMIGEFCDRFNADPNRVLDIIYEDRRNYKPGLGFAGPCFPRDVGCFRETAHEESIDSAYRFANLLEELNKCVVEKYLNIIKEQEKKKIGILGVAYKPNVPYVYESQPLMIAQKLLDDSYEVYIYDILAEENAKQVLHGGKLHFCSSIEECEKLSELLFIGTPNFAGVKTSKPIVNPWR